MSGSEEPTGPNATLASGTAVILAGTVIGLILGFLARSIPARLLGPDQYGLLMLGWSTVSILGIVAYLGFRDGIIRYVPRADTDAAKRGIFVTALSITLPWSIILALIVFFAVKPLATIVFSDPAVAPIIRIFAVLLPFVTLQRLSASLFRGYKRARERVLIENIINPGLRTILIVAAILAGFTAVGAAAAWVLAMVVTAIFAIFFVYRLTPIGTVKTGRFRHRELLLFSAPLMLSGVMGIVLNFGDNFLIGAFIGTTGVGTYDSAYMIGSLVTTGLTAFAYMFLPIFSELHAAGDTQQMSDLYRTSTKWAISITVPVYLTFALYPGSTLVLIFGPQYAAGSTVLAVIATGFFVNVVVGLCVQALVSIGATRFILRTNIVAAVANLLLNVLLIPRFGIVGAAIASALTQVGYNCLYTYKLYRETDITPLPPRIILPVVVTAAVAVTIRILGGAFRGSGWLLPVFAAVIAGCYLGLYIALGGVSEADIELLKSVEEKSGLDLSRVEALLRAGRN